MFGVGGLVAWNAILSILDFFIHFQKDYSPEYVYPMMNFVLNVVLQFLLIFFGNKFSYKVQIFASLVVSGIALVLLPIVVYGIQGVGGFLVTSFIILFQGFANAVLLSGFYGIASFLPIKYLIAFSTGQGLSGIIMNVIRYIVIFAFGDSEDDSTITKGAVVFFVIAALLILVNIYFLQAIYKEPYFVSMMAKSGEFSKEDLATYNLIEEDDQKINQNTEILPDKEKKSDFSRVIKMIVDLCFLLTLNYLLTFIVFPGVCIQGKLFSLSPALNGNTLMLIFNVCDTIGRYGPNIFSIGKNNISTIVFFRFIFVLTFSLIAISVNVSFLGFFGNSFFVIINMMLFSITNGYNTSIIFSTGPSLVSDDLKGKAGSTLSFFLIVGIFSGTLYALFIIKNLI